MGDHVLPRGGGKYGYAYFKARYKRIVRELRDGIMHIREEEKDGQPVYLRDCVYASPPKEGVEVGALLLIEKCLPEILKILESIEREHGGPPK